MQRPLVIGSAAILLAGCIEAVGPVGPSGPPGNANVHAVTISFSLQDAALNGNVASQGYDVPDITPSVVDRGAVLVYFRDQRTWTALPFTVGIESADVVAVDYTFTLGYAYDDGFVEIFVEASTDDEVIWSDIVNLLPEEYIMKVVVIDGFGAARKAGLDPTDFEAVQAFYGLDAQ